MFVREPLVKLTEALLRFFVEPEKPARKTWQSSVQHYTVASALEPPGQPLAAQPTGVELAQETAAGPEAESEAPSAQPTSLEFVEEPTGQPADEVTDDTPPPSSVEAPWAASVLQSPGEALVAQPADEGSAGEPVEEPADELVEDDQQPGAVQPAWTASALEFPGEELPFEPVETPTATGLDTEPVDHSADLTDWLVDAHRDDDTAPVETTAVAVPTPDASSLADEARVATPPHRGSGLAALQATSSIVERLGLGYHLGSAVERIAAGAGRGSAGAPALKEAVWLIERYVALLEGRPIGADLHASAARLARFGDALAELKAAAGADDRAPEHGASYSHSVAAASDGDDAHAL
jgi:hypothetical protein